MDYPEAFDTLTHVVGVVKQLREEYRNGQAEDGVPQPEPDAAILGSEREGGAKAIEEILKSQEKDKTAENPPQEK